MSASSSVSHTTVNGSAPPASSASTATANDDIVIGVLALQGAFLEHVTTLKSFGVKTVTVRTPEELDSRVIDALIIPGGESTTMALVAERWQLVDALKQWIADARPVFGTCAGMIMLSRGVEHQKLTGQLLIGGLDITVLRNAYGTQLGSFEGYYDAPVLAKRYGGDSQTHAVFIRAPGILSVDSDKVDVLATIPATDSHYVSMAHSDHCLHKGDTQPAGKTNGHTANECNVIAVRQGNILATTFHPELTVDNRWHRLFVDLVRHDKQQRRR